MKAYEETDSGAAVAVANQSFNSLTYRAGLSVSKHYEVGGMILTPQARLSYEHQQFQDNGAGINLLNTTINARTASEVPGRQYMVLGLGLNLGFSESFSINLNYNGQFLRENASAHYGSISFDLSF
jgi:outer membrane autotransporter protein